MRWNKLSGPSNLQVVHSCPALQGLCYVVSHSRRFSPDLDELLVFLILGNNYKGSQKSAYLLHTRR